MTTTAIGLGSNVGDRFGHLAAAVVDLADVGNVTAVSPIFETAPVGGPDQGPFLNAVAIVDTSFGARELLDRLLAIERRHGRRRGERWGPRTLDLDLLLFGDEEIDRPGLVVPHRGLTERRFVLEPLLAVWPSAALADGRPLETFLDAVADQTVRPVTGSYHAGRWMDPLAAATTLEPVTSRSPDGAAYAGTLSADWANTLGAVFGGIPVSLGVRAATATVPGMHPVAMAHGFLHRGAPGADVQVDTIVERRTRRDASVSYTMRSDGVMIGSGRVRLGTGRSGPNAARGLPSTIGLSGCRSLDELLPTVGISPGPAIRNWKVLERWDLASLDPAEIDRRRRDPVFRAWVQAAAIAPDDPGLAAAACLLPLDALGWPAVHLLLGGLGRPGMPATPTIELFAVFHDLASTAGWYLVEAVGQATRDGHAGAAITVWGRDGRLLASGSSTMVTVER